jgi:hypothetical protein
LIAEGAEFEGEEGGHTTISGGSYKILKRASPGTACKNLKFSMTLSYLNSAVTMVSESSLGNGEVYTTKTGMNMRTTFFRKPMLESRS